MNNHSNPAEPPPSDASIEEDNEDIEDVGQELLQSLNNQQKLELELNRETINVRAGREGFTFSKNGLVKILQSFANNQPAPFESVYVDFSANAADCQEFSRKMGSSKIKSKAVHITCGGIAEAIAILLFFDEVRSIHMDVSSNLNFQSTLDVQELCELPQWKNAKEVEVRDFLIINPVESMNVENHQSIKLSLDDLKSQSAAYLVGLFNGSETMTEVKASFASLESDIVIPMRFNRSGTVTCNLRAPNGDQPGKFELKKF